MDGPQRDGTDGGSPVGTPVSAHAKITRARRTLPPSVEEVSPDFELGTLLPAVKVSGLVGRFDILKPVPVPPGGSCTPGHPRGLMIQDEDAAGRRHQHI
jgi:hypothetical protein